MVIKRPCTNCIPIVAVIVAFLLVTGCTTPSILITREQQQGDISFNQHKYQYAIQHYNNMLDASKKLGVYRNLSMEADVLRKLANCYEMLGQYNNARDHVVSAFAIDSIENNTLSIIEDYRMLGKIDLYEGNNFGAISYFEKALSLSDGMDQALKSENRNAIAENQLALGQLYATMGRFNKSLAAISNALELFKSTGDKKGEMESLLTMGSVYINLGNLDFAKSLTEKSALLAEGIEVSTSRHFNNLARISSTLGEFEDAIRYQEAALSEAKRFNIAAQKVWFTIRMGDIYRDLGDYERSMEYYKKARIIKDTINLETRSLEASLDLRSGKLISARDYFTDQGSAVGAGITYMRMAELALINSEISDAMPLFEKAESYFISSDNKIGQASVHLHKGIIYSLQNDYSIALRQFDAAKKSGDFPEIKWQSFYQEGLVYEKQNNLNKACNSYLEAVKIIEQIRGNLTIEEFKSKFINNKIDVYDRLINIYLRLDQPQLALGYTEKAKARTFLEMLANRKINFTANKSDSLIGLEQDKRFEIQQLYKQLQNISTGVHGDNKTRQINKRNLVTELNNKQDEYDDILERLKLFNPEYSQIVSVAPVNTEDLRSSLDCKTAIISYWISNDEILLWLISKNYIVQRSVPIARESLTKTISDARRYIASNAIAQAKIEMQKLYNYLIEPISNEISDFSNLIIVPNKSLHFLPFQALLGKNDQYLVEQYNISYEPSLSVHSICQNRDPVEGNRFFGAALSDISIGLNIGLPGTKDELNRILPLFTNNLSAFGEASTETFVKENVGGYKFIHLATHGFFNFEQPVYSFLLFPPSNEDDGRLTVHEVFELNLNARLVTLSACETGLGYLDRGDEIVGLSRAFIYAGSSSVIVSLWSVADYQTSLLMTKFYTYMKEYSLEESLAMAQREVMELYPNPIFWAPFFLIGKGN
ncbi:MAG: CHAT domain-containing protein [Bacteroidales bacterium]|nr:CHAT domain-containing protein [Bacteroidales bacterium]